MQGALFIVLLLAASFVDLKRREIPDWVSGGIAALSLLHIRPECLLGIIPALFFLAAAVRGGIGGGDVKLAAACGLVLGLQHAMMGTMLGLLLQRLFHLCCRFLKGRCGLHIQWLHFWPLDMRLLIMFRRSRKMKKRVLSLFVLIGCMSVLGLRFRKRADRLQ